MKTQRAKCAVVAFSCLQKALGYSPSNVDSRTLVSPMSFLMNLDGMDFYCFLFLKVFIEPLTVKYMNQPEIRGLVAHRA